MTWSDKDYGDSSAVQAALIGVETIYSTSHAFAALLWNGTVVTWGNKMMGGDFRTVQAALIGVESLFHRLCVRCSLEGWDYGELGRQVLRW